MLTGEQFLSSLLPETLTRGRWRNKIQLSTHTVLIPAQVESISYTVLGDTEGIWAGGCTF